MLNAGIILFFLHCLQFLLSGILTVKSELDREEIDNYHLSINAIDGGGRSCDIDVYIELSDVNDNSPRFIGIPDNFQVMESTERDTLLMRVRAIDDDLGKKRRINHVHCT